MSKKPKIATVPRISKTPSFAEKPASPWQMSPSWRIGSIDTIEPWGWHVVTAEELKSIHSKLAEFERRTWNEILVQGGHQSHTIHVGQICSAAQKRLEDLGYGDLDHLVSLRLTGKSRVWGVLNEAVLTLLWWDPDHSVYPVPLKHT